MFEQPYDAVSWLGEKGKNPHLYRLLRGGLVFRHQESPLFQACVALSEMLRDEPDVVRRLIHHHDWRIYLIGNVVAVINHDSRFEKDYVEKIMLWRGHFIETLVSGWMIVNTSETFSTVEAFLREVRVNSHKSDNPVSDSLALSVYTALRVLGCEEADRFEKTAFLEDSSKISYIRRMMERIESIYSAYLTYHPLTS